LERLLQRVVNIIGALRLFQLIDFTYHFDRWKTDVEVRAARPPCHAQANVIDAGCGNDFVITAILVRNDAPAPKDRTLLAHRKIGLHIAEQPVVIDEHDVTLSIIDGCDIEAIVLGIGIAFQCRT